jgi:hypothetical protein
MYVLGHCVTAERTGLFSDAAIFGDGLYAVMMPDYLRCHDWGYDCCFDPSAPGREAALLRSHVLGDWFVHYGGDRGRIKHGWAYRNMGGFARVYDEFFAVAEASGLRDASRPRDSRRGFAHSMVEYAIDIHLARTGEYDGHLADIVARLGALGRGTGLGSRPWILATAAAIGAPIHAELLDRDVASFSGRIARSRDVGEFVLRAAIEKFGLHETDASIEHVRAYLDPGTDEIGAPAFDHVLAEATEFLHRVLAAQKEPPSA